MKYTFGRQGRPIFPSFHQLCIDPLTDFDETIKRRITMLLGIATLLILILNICIVSLVPTAHQPFAIYCDVVKFAG